MFRLNRVSVFVARTASVALVAFTVLAAISSAHAEQSFGCTLREMDKTPLGFGYETYISFGASQDPTVTRRKSKCGAEQMNTFGVVNDSLEGDAWVVSMSGQYEMMINPGQIVLKETYQRDGTHLQTG